MLPLMENGDSSYLVISPSKVTYLSCYDLGLKYKVSLEKSGTHVSWAEGLSCGGCSMAPWQVEYSNVCAQRQPPHLVPSQVPVCYVVGSIKTYQAEVLLVLPNSLHLWGVQNRFIIWHALLCIFLVFFLGIGFKNEDGKHQRDMDQWDLK